MPKVKLLADSRKNARFSAKNRGDPVTTGIDAGNSFTLYGFSNVRETALRQQAGFHGVVYDAKAILASVGEMEMVEAGRRELLEMAAARRYCPLRLRAAMVTNPSGLSPQTASRSRVGFAATMSSTLIPSFSMA